MRYNCLKFFSILLLSFILINCKDTEVRDLPCIKVELLDVLYINDKYILHDLYEFNDSEHKDYLNDYFVKTNKLIFRISGLNECNQSNFVYNKFGEVLNHSAYKLYDIIEHDTVCVGNRFDLIDSSIVERLFLCSIRDTVDFKDNNYMILRIEDFDKIKDGFLCISAFKYNLSLCCTDDSVENLFEYGGGICFAIKNGKLTIDKQIND